MTKPTPSHNSPVSIGIDFHKRYSVFCVLDAKGGILERGRIEHTTPELFVELAKRYPKARVVFETTMNWAWLYGTDWGQSHIFTLFSIFRFANACRAVRSCGLVPDRDLPHAGFK